MGEAAFEAREPHDLGLSGRGRRPHSLVGRGEGEARLERVSVRPRDLVQRAWPVGVSLREQIACVAEQRGRGRLVASLGGPPAARRVARGGLERQPAGVVVERAQLLQQPVRAVQVVGDDLFLLLDPIARHVDDPRRVSLVQGGADRLRRGLVRRVTDQQVPEPERVLADQ